MDAGEILAALTLASASAWLGAALYQVRITDPVLRDAGANAIGFAQAHARRHGTGMFFAAFAVGTVLLAVATYLTTRAFDAPLSGRALWLGLGALAAIAGLARGATANRVAEARWMRAVKRGDVGEMLAAHAVAARANALTVAVVAIAVLCLLASRAFA